MEDFDLNSDETIEAMYFQYIFVFVYLHKIEVIQRYYRYYQFKKFFNRLRHKIKMKRCLDDIIELGYIPPTEEYQLFQKGGFRYREGLKSFNECYLKLNV